MVKSLLFLFLFAAQVGLGLESQNTTTIEEGAPCTFFVPIPEPQALGPFQAYIGSLVIGRPLPWPYLLENFSLKENSIMLTGRCLVAGTFDIPLGVFAWEGKSFVLPLFHITATPRKLPVLGVSDLLLPFPDKVVGVSQANRKVQAAVSIEAQKRLFADVGIQKKVQEVFYVMVLAALTAPLWIYGLKRMRKRAPQSEEERPTIQERVRHIREKVKGGRRPWTELLALLNSLRGEEKPPLTSYELVQYYVAAKEVNLAKAATLIDQHSYRDGEEPTLLTVLQVLEQASSSQKGS